MNGAGEESWRTWRDGHGDLQDVHGVAAWLTGALWWTTDRKGLEAKSGRPPNAMVRH